ncbi:MAG: GAF domain-containing protein [Gammaproteobacteria bacterium]|nr:MAG: GAF domain-containing protein [Gammaproteobacteria bacterium]
MPIDDLPKPEQYRSLTQQAQALLECERDRIANAANLAALLFHSLPAVNWVGFYLFDGQELVLGPFQGQPACVRIELGKGVCGTAAATGRTQVVDHVDAFPGHIACDTASRSEVVVPLHGPDGSLIGVLDIDSPEPARFDDDDRRGIEALACIYLQACAPIDRD